MDILEDKSPQDENSTYQEVLYRFRTRSGMSLQTIKKSLDIAHEKFNGDILLGFAYVEARSYAVYRGVGQQKENSLLRDAVGIAKRFSEIPEFMAFKEALEAKETLTANVFQ